MRPLRIIRRDENGAAVIEFAIAVVGSVIISNCGAGTFFEAEVRILCNSLS